MLGGFAHTKYYGKHAAIIFHNLDDYYAYASHFYKDDGEYAGSGGLFIKTGYNHILVSDDDVRHLWRTLTHELAHNCMSHLPLPLWLNEAITGGIEESVSGVPNFQLNREIAAEHYVF